MVKPKVKFFARVHKDHFDESKRSTLSILRSTEGNGLVLKLPKTEVSAEHRKPPTATIGNEKRMIKMVKYLE